MGYDKPDIQLFIEIMPSKVTSLFFWGFLLARIILVYIIFEFLSQVHVTYIRVRECEVDEENFHRTSVITIVISKNNGISENNSATTALGCAESSVEFSVEGRQAGRRGELARRPAGRRCQLGSIIWSLPATHSSADAPTTQLFAVDSPATAAQSAFGSSLCWFVHRPFLSFAPFQYFCSTEADRYKFFTSL